MKIPKLSDLIKAIVGLPAKASSSSGTEDLGSAIDLVSQPEFRSGLIVCNTGAATGSPSSFSIVYRLLECATSGGTYTAVTGATVTVDAAGVAEIPFDPKGRLRYLKVGRTVTITGGSSPTVPNGATVLLGDPKYGPQ